ncbi:hypothetical protein PIIN_07786 [Serendipita indica DSM 11827]|uniref:F-box domain-containing protein n=1 Tax=Serendipita indica (strain DSM 11827) TaxID=1109443 RepID=G4TR89_SERID|nr:hypothetical protein PIIN_07786 [Serendipita indica DSM 11827]
MASYCDSNSSASPSMLMLPIETRLHIFRMASYESHYEESLGAKSRRLTTSLRISRVCRQWRTEVLGDPHMWRDLFIDLWAPRHALVHFWEFILNRVKMPNVNVHIQALSDWAKDGTMMADHLRLCAQPLKLIRNIGTLQLDIAGRHACHLGGFFGIYDRTFYNLTIRCFGSLQSISTPNARPLAAPLEALLRRNKIRQLTLRGAGPLGLPEDLVCQKLYRLDVRDSGEDLSDERIKRAFPCLDSYRIHNDGEMRESRSKCKSKQSSKSSRHR